MGDRDQVSHADIYRALGILEGKLDSLGKQLSQKHDDLATALSRITDLEKAVAKGIGIAIAASVVIPILVTALAPRLHLGHIPPPPPAAQMR